MNYPISWVKLEKYVEITGDSVDAVMGRRKLGKWLDGQQCKIVDGRVWVNLKAVEKWVEKWGEPSTRAGALPAPVPPVPGDAFGAYLSASELAGLTGCKSNQRIGMAAWLDKNNWPYVVDRNGLPKVSRAFHDAKMGGLPVKDAIKYADEPNRAAFDKKLP